MNAEPDRDRALDQALKAALGRGADAPITPACLDAETLAAWMDGGLDAQTVAMAEAHASSCARCQAMLGTLARVTPEVAATSASPVRFWRWWLAPLAAGAAAVTLWMVVPTERYNAPPQQKAAQEVAPEPPAAPAAAAPARDTVTAAPERLQKNAPSARNDQQDPNKLANSGARANSAADTADFSQLKRNAEGVAKADDKPAERRDRAEPRALEESVAVTSQAARAAATPPAAPPPAAAALGQLRAQIALPDGVQITSNSSPSPDVIWFVGRAGVVLLTTDGKTVTRLPFPETTDLTAVTASDARTAVVTTVDGRRFRTEDGGKTWRRQ